MDDLGYNDSQHPPSEVHIAGDHMSRGERMSSPIPDSPLSSAPNSAPSSPGHQHPSLHGYTGDLDSVDELKDGLNEAGRLLNLPELDHEKPHRMETDPGMIPILLPVPSTKSEAPFDEAGLEAVAPTASPVVFSPIPVRSKPKNTLWKRENHHNNDDNDDYEDDEDNLLSSSHPRSSPVSLQQRRLMKNRRQSANMKLNTSNISSSSSIPNTTGGGSQHQQLNLNSPSTISVQQQDPKQSKADIVSRAKQVMARRSSATLPFEDEIVVNVNSNDDDDDDEIPDDERRATSRSSMNSGTPPHQFSGRVSNATAIAIGSGLALALSPRDEQREVPMDEPDPPSPVRSLPDSSDFDLVDDLQQQAPSMDVAPSMDEARPIRLHGSVAAATSSKSFDYEDDYQHQHSYLDESFLPNRSVKHQPKAIVSITTTATASVLSPAHTVQTARLSPGLHVTTTDAVQVQEGNEIDDDGGGFETHIVPPAPDSPFSDQQSAVSKVDESFYSSDGSLEKYRDEEVEISFNDDNSYTDDDDEDDPLSGILDPGQFPRMAAKAFVSAQTDFTNFIMGRPGMEEEDSASPTRSEVEPPLPRRKPEPTGSQVVSKLLPTGGQVISKLEPTRGQVVSKSEPMGDQVVSKLEPTGGQAVSKSEPRGGQVVTNSKPIGGQVMMNSESTGDQVIPTALLARDHYQDTAAAAAAAAIYNSDGDTGFGWVDDLVHESVGLVGKMAVSDTFKSFKAAAVSDQIQSGVCMPLDFADSTTVAPKGVQRIEQGSSLTPKLAKSFSSISSGSSVADDDSKTRLSRGQILDDLVAKSMEEAETVNGSPVRKNGKDGVWWLELELSKREAVKQAGGPLGSAEKAMAIGARDDNFQKAAAPQAKTSPSKRSSKDSQQGKPKPSKFWQGVRIKRSEQYNEVMSDEEEREQVMADGLGEGSGTDSMAKYDMKSTVESPLPKEPPSLRRSSNTFDADLSLDDVPPRDDEPPSLRPLSSNAPSSIKSVQPPSLTAPEDEPPFLSPSASLSPSNDDQRLASNPLHQSGSGGNTALSPDDNDDDDDAASHSMDVLMNSLDDMVNSLEALTPTGLQEHAKSNDVERVKSPQEDIPTPKQRVRADPDAISNGSPIEDISTRSQRVRADPDAISNGKLILVESIDNDFGIPIGDIMISLLNEDTDVSWASRVHEAIWRCRTMRRNFDSKYLQGKHEHQPGNPSVGRTSVPVDVDDARMIGGVGSVSKTQGAAQEHLRYDDFDDALMLYEDIIFSYYRFFDGVLKKSEAELLEQNMTGKVSDFKPYIGAALHNIGMVHLLKGDHEAAFTHFERAVLNRAACLGNGHVDYVTSLVKMATCQFALEDFPRAHSNLEEALSLSGYNTETVSDYRQLAEILNNLGCLSYMGGKPDKAKALFKESLQAQAIAADDSLYTGTQFSWHSASLNMSIARGNVGFIALVTRDIPTSTAALESAVKEQQLLLRDAHVTLISTMDHLVVTNLLGGRLQKALQMLRRMLQMQLDAFGPSDMRCLRTANKIENLQNQESESAKSTQDDEEDSHHDGKLGKKTKKKRVLNVFKSIIKKK